MKVRLTIKSHSLRALFCTFILIATSTMGCITSNRAKHAAETDAAKRCQANLDAIDGAKKIWALENHKMDTKIPNEDDLIGLTEGIRYKPICLSGGIYTLGAVSEPPTCPIPGHVFR